MGRGGLPGAVALAKHVEDRAVAGFTESEQDELRAPLRRVARTLPSAFDLMTGLRRAALWSGTAERGPS